jgi:hypothetical protein
VRIASLQIRESGEWKSLAIQPLPAQVSSAMKACRYTYSLDPLTNEQQSFNELRGFGTGVMSMVMKNCSTSLHPRIAAANDETNAVAKTPVDQSWG